MTPAVNTQENGWRIPERFGDVPTGEIALPEQTDLPASLSARKLRKGVRKRFKNIWAMEVEYSYTQHSLVSNMNVGYSRRRFAFKGNKHFCADSNYDREMPFEYPYVVLAFDGTRFVSYRPGDRIAEVNTLRDRRLFEDSYLAVVGVPFKGDHERLAIVDSVSSWARSLETLALGWRVRPTLEAVDGALCHVLESWRGNHRLWVDPEVGFAVRFEEHCSSIPGLPANEWPPVMRHAFRDYRRADETHWFPWQIELAWFDRNKERDASEPQVSMSHSCQVQKLAVNDEVADELFDPQFPDGTIAVDYAHERG